MLMDHPPALPAPTPLFAGGFPCRRRFPTRRGVQRCR